MLNRFIKLCQKLGNQTQLKHGKLCLYDDDHVRLRLGQVRLGLVKVRLGQVRFSLAQVRLGYVILGWVDTSAFVKVWLGQFKYSVKVRSACGLGGVTQGLVQVSHSLMFYLTDQSQTRMFQCGWLTGKWDQIILGWILFLTDGVFSIRSRVKVQLSQVCLGQDLFFTYG